MPSKPTQRTLAELKELGFTSQVVERFNRFANRRIDLFGVIDVLAVRQGVGIIGIQCCAGTDHARRKTKALAEPKLKSWLDAGGRFEVWSWSKKGARGERKTWQLRREEVLLDQLDAA